MAVRKHSQSRVLPSAKLAYETGVSAGSIAILADGHPGAWPQDGAPTRNCTRLACLPSRYIADNALGALKMVGARRLAPAFAPGYGGRASKAA